jgi:hypothetical protein
MKYFLNTPIENLEVEQEFTLGRITFHPSSYSEQLLAKETKRIEHSNYPQEVKTDVASTAKEQHDLFIKNKALCSLEVDDTEDNESVYVEIKQALAILYLLQKDIAGRYSIEKQKFGLARDLQRSTMFTYRIYNRDFIASGWTKHGVVGDWKFIKEKITDFPQSDIFLLFNHALLNSKKTDIEKRLLSSTLWLYDATLDYNYSTRVVKIATALEALLVDDTFFANKDTKVSKEFTLAYFSELLFCPCADDKGKHHCPLPDSKVRSISKYKTWIEQKKISGFCSMFWDMVGFYELRSTVVHDAEVNVSENRATTFEWIAHRMIRELIRLTVMKKFQTIEQVRVYLESKHGKIKGSVGNL